MEILRILNSSTGEWEEVPAIKGADGFSPSAKIAQTDEGAVITFVDATGSSSATIKHGEKGADGADGKTPVRGTDYWTSADQEQIVADVLAALPAAEGVSV